MALPIKNINGDIFSGLITDVDPNMMNADGNRTSIDRIVIHHNATTNDAVARSTWYVGGAAGTSAHYQVTPDKLWGCVGENMVAYHAGNYPMNQRSIGIEHLNETLEPGWTIAEATYRRSAALIADICQRHGIPIDREHIIKHGEVSSTACPGGIDIDRLVRMAKEIANGGGATPASAPSLKKYRGGHNLMFLMIFDEKVGSFNKYEIWLGDATRGVYYYINHPEELRFIKDSYKKNSGGLEIPEYHCSNGFPVHARLISGYKLKKI